jgi:hypothetical protein
MKEQISGLPNRGWNQAPVAGTAPFPGTTIPQNLAEKTRKLITEISRFWGILTGSATVPATVPAAAQQETTVLGIPGSAGGTPALPVARLNAR